MSEGGVCVRFKIVRKRAPLLQHTYFVIEKIPAAAHSHSQLYYSSYYNMFSATTSYVSVNTRFLTNGKVFNLQRLNAKSSVRELLVRGVSFDKDCGVIA